MQSTRGPRSLNPGNIRHSAVSYPGESPSADRAFNAFTAREWGYRAMFVLLYTYLVRYEDCILRQMTGRYAPPTENDTDGYICTVSARSGIGPEGSIDVSHGGQMKSLVSTMSYVENGVPAVTEKVEKGWELFLQHRP